MGAPWRDHPSWQLVWQLSEVVGRDLAELLLDASPDTLRATRNSQLATYTLSLVAFDAARNGPFGEGVRAEQLAAVAGHSLGEYTALVAAGALSASQGVTLVQARGEAMQSAAEANPGTMAAVIGLELEGVTDACDAVEGAWVANDNSPGQVVIAGTLHGVEDAGAAALKRGAKRVIPLQVGGAFHTPLMQPAQASLDAALAAAEFAPTPLPVVANVDASPHTDDFRDLLSAQLCSQVRWRDSLVALAGTGANLFVELGPGTELSGMVRRTVPDVARLNVAGPEDLEALASAINS
jgi:[acyl-carrier-protein] S-malonyltransferase